MVDGRNDAVDTRRIMDHMANEKVQFLQLYFMDLLGRTKSKGKKAKAVTADK